MDRIEWLAWLGHRRSVTNYSLPSVEVAPLEYPFIRIIPVGAHPAGLHGDIVLGVVIPSYAAIDMADVVAGLMKSDSVVKNLCQKC